MLLGPSGMEKILLGISVVDIVIQKTPSSTFLVEICQYFITAFGLLPNMFAKKCRFSKFRSHVFKPQLILSLIFKYF